MQAINNNSYSSQGIQPVSAYNQTNQVHMPKPPVANPIAHNTNQAPVVQSQPMQLQMAQQQTQPAPQLMQPQQQTQTAQAQPMQMQQIPTQQVFPQQAQAMPMYPQGLNIPSGGAVNINIFNPTTTNGAPVYPQNTYYTNPATTYPAYVPQNAVNVPQMPAPQNAYPAVQTQQMNVQMPGAQQLQTQNTQGANQTQQTAEAAPKQEEKPKDVAPLNDEYIRTLENYLNDNDPKVRLMGTTELLNRFKELEARKQDPALTALLNKALKDPSASVRQMALTILNVGYAAGNEETTALLNNIQANTSSETYAEDALVAKEILLKQAQQVPTPGTYATAQV
ncbi:HEAT repeat domain-containing protein [bacterium]|nr:HEAT repeat domain-containing protein [bacterium]